MAIDSAQKRFAIMNLATPVTSFLPIPNGAITESDRKILIHLYSFESVGGGDSRFSFGKAIGQPLGANLGRHV
jgi:hypothetical protein